MGVKVVLTGGTGFAGRALINRLLKDSDNYVVSLQRSASTPREGLEIINWDFREEPPERVVKAAQGADYFIHLGSAVHALHSIKDPGFYFNSNVTGTFHALRAAMESNPKKFVYMSTAEVLGGREEGYSAEDDPFQPSNPYAASKACAEIMVQAFRRTYGVPAIVIRTMNLYGEGQTGDKFVPMVEKAVLEGTPVIIHVLDGRAGMRQWMAVDVFVERLLDLLPGAVPGEIYHLVGEEITNREMACRVANRLGRDIEMVEEPISKTHAWRYAIRSTK